MSNLETDHATIGEVSSAVDVVDDGAEHVTAGDRYCRHCSCHQNLSIIEFARRVTNGSISYLQVCNTCYA